MMFAAAIGLLAAIAAAWAIYLLGRFYKQRTRAIERARSDLDKFYHAAQSILKDDSVPDSVAWFVERFAAEAMQPRLALRIGGKILSGTLGKRVPGAASLRVMEEFDSLTTAQQETVADCVAYGLLVSAASNIFVGERLRSLLIFSLFNRPSEAQVTQHVDAPQKAIGIAVRYTSDYARKHPAELEACPAI